MLREQDYSEADRILTLLTPGGKVTVLARGVRKPTSRKTGHLGLFHRSQLMLAQGSNMDLVTQAEVLDAMRASGTISFVSPMRAMLQSSSICLCLSTRVPGAV